MIFGLIFNWSRETFDQPSLTVLINYMWSWCYEWEQDIRENFGHHNQPLFMYENDLAAKTSRFEIVKTLGFCFSFTICFPIFTIGIISLRAIDLYHRIQKVNIYIWLYGVRRAIGTTDNEKPIQKLKRIPSISGAIHIQELSNFDSNMCVLIWKVWLFCEYTSKHEFKMKPCESVTCSFPNEIALGHIT